ncbi:MAG: hypothetical protein ACKO0N_02485, partial [Planctomycetota bacterium]
PTLSNVEKYLCFFKKCKPEFEVARQIKRPASAITLFFFFFEQSFCFRSRSDKMIGELLAEPSVTRR